MAIIVIIISFFSTLGINNPEGYKHKVKNELERLLIVTCLYVKSASECDLIKPLYENGDTL